ncbi:hypothetical protein IFG57_003992 [Salmonella enterica]|nr:hypothetical protein [Salmonella enterica]
MNRLICLTISVGVLSGCSSAPPLSMPKGDFEELNTDVTALLPAITPIYITDKKDEKKNTPPNVSSVSTSMLIKTTHSGEAMKKPLNIDVPKSVSTIAIVKPKILTGFVIPKATIAKLSAPDNKTSVNATKKLSSSTSAVLSKPSQYLPSKSVAAPPPIKFTIKKGETLRSGFAKWAGSDNCAPNKKWEVRWETDTDYPIDYELVFYSQTFEGATEQLFTLYSKAQIPLFVSGFRQQCLIEVSDKS